MKNLLTLSLLALLFSQCAGDASQTSAPEEAAPAPSVTLEKAPFGALPDGQEVDIFTLKNSNGMEVKIITYGGIITSWTAPDKAGVYEDIVLGYPTLDEYLKSSPYFGAIIGRYGNRIAGGRFSIGNSEYQLAANNAPNHLHGGLKGFDKVVWNAATSGDSNAVSLKLSYLSSDLEEGYPGNLQTTVTYTLTAGNSLEVTYEATTDQSTIVNLTQHSYFNLSGDFSKTILDHELTIRADHYLPVDPTLIPTGELAEVAGTPFDFRTAKPIGRDIGADHEQLENGRGYDHCWALNEQNGEMRLAATAWHPGSGRLLEVFTDEPGLQFYSGNFLDGTLPAKNGGAYAHRTGFCLETQHYPDSPNQPTFPSVLLNPGEKYRSKTTFRFSVK